ncbi:MAG: phospholipase D-like domain-containing protein [Alphaproteobacteria bacterium]
MDDRTRQFEAALGAPFTHGNQISVLKNGDEIFPAMLSAIEDAQVSIEFLTFIYWKGEIAERLATTLANKAKRGVDTRVILDAYGAYAMPRSLVQMMEISGVQVHWFRPLRFGRLSSAHHRTHRKVLVIDGRTGFTGGVGVAKEWEGNAQSPTDWRDTHFRITGPAVDGLRSAFIGNWAETARPVTLSSPAIVDHDTSGSAMVQTVRSTASFGWSDIATMIDTAINVARKRVRIATAYFVPDDDTVQLLCDTARRGVEIEIMLPGTYSDQRVSRLASEAAFSPLLDAGIKLWSYERTMLHCKIMLIDDDLCCVGTANFNQRSMRQDDELALVVCDHALVAELDGHFEEDLGASERILSAHWRRRSLLQRIKERAVRLVHGHV